MSNNICYDIEIKNLCKSYGTKKVLNGISFSVERGSVMGFLGANGAGKSTTMNILTGYISSDSGVAKICGKDILTDPMGAKKNIGYLPEIPPVYMDMTVWEYLCFVYDLKKVKEERNKHLNQIIEKVKIDGVKKRLIKNLSKGYRQRVGLAQALVGDPKVLILDEPTVGLDPVQIVEFRNIIKSLKGEHTVILSTHILQEVTAVCDSVTIIGGGKVAVSDKIENLSASNDEKRCSIKVKGNKDEAVAVLNGVKSIKAVQRKNESKGVCSFEIASSQDIREEIFKAFAKTNMYLIEIKGGNSPIEELFVKAISSETVAEKGGDK